MAEPRIKQSACWGCFCRGDVTPELMVQEVAKTGYKSIEMGPQEHWALIKDAGLDIAIFVGHKSLPDGLNDPNNFARIEDELLASIDLAVEWDIPSILCLSGNRHGLSDREGMENCATCLSRVVKVAEEKGKTLAVELLNSKVNHPDYQCDSTPWGVALCDMVGSPRVRVLYDIYHMQIMEGDLIRTITDNIDYIAHFHTAGNPGRRDMDDEQEIYYPAVMRAIADSGYTGYVGHEFGPKGDPLEAMRAAFETCDV